MGSKLQFRANAHTDLASLLAFLPSRFVLSHPLLLCLPSHSIGIRWASPGKEVAAMQIRVRCGCGESSCLEWAVVELQGVVQPQPSFTGDIRGLHKDPLCSGPSTSSSSSKARCTFTVGYHELACAGSKVALKKPLLVLRKKKASGGDQEPPTVAAADVELEVIGIIRQKILFKDRPKALISSNQSTHCFSFLLHNCF